MKRIAIAAFLTAFSLTAGAQEVKLVPLEEQKVAEMKALLSDDNFFFAPRCGDRASWKAAYNAVGLKGLRKRADKLVSEDGSCTMPFFQEDWIGKWWSVKKTNDSDTGKKLLTSRIGTPMTLAVACCATGDEKYEKAAVDALAKLVRQPVWCYPRNYNPETGAHNPPIELAAQAIGSAVGSVLYMLGDRIPAELRREALDSLQNRIWGPIISNVTAGSTVRNGWLTGTANWNPACLSGVLISALAAADKDTRAKVAYIADRYVDNYLRSFKSDGYCTEGLSYYNYGFDKYIMVREALYRATQGAVDIYRRNPKLRNMMLFPFNLQMYNGVDPLKNLYAIIGDCGLKTKPSQLIEYYNLKYLGLSNPALENYDLSRQSGAGAYTLLLKFTDFDSFEPMEASGGPLESAPLRSYFDESGFLVARSAPEAVSDISASFKGGNNKEMHNHNDVGSYTIVQDKVFMVEDPGIAPYTGMTFGPRRYQIKTLSSYGHDVPLIDDVCQGTVGTSAPVLQADFSDKADRWAIELKDFYDIKDLVSVKRSFEFTRGLKTSVTVKDEFSARDSHSWSTAISTRAEVSIKKGVITLSRDGQTMVARVKASGPVEITAEEIKGGNESKSPFTRIAVRLTGAPRTSGWITVSYNK